MAAGPPESIRDAFDFAVIRLSGSSRPHSLTTGPIHPRGQHVRCAHVATRPSWPLMFRSPYGLPRRVWPSASLAARHGVGCSLREGRGQGYAPFGRSALPAPDLRSAPSPQPKGVNGYAVQKLLRKKFYQECAHPRSKVELRPIGFAHASDRGRSDDAQVAEQFYRMGRWLVL